MRDILKEEDHELIKAVLMVVKLAVTNPTYSPDEDGNAIENIINLALEKL